MLWKRRLATILFFLTLPLCHHSYFNNVDFTGYYISSFFHTNNFILVTFLSITLSIIFSLLYSSLQKTRIMIFSMYKKTLKRIIIKICIFTLQSTKEKVLHKLIPH